MRIHFSYRLIRRISQIIFLFLFLWLFRLTDYNGTDEIIYAVNIFFRWNPLIAACAVLAGKVLIAVFLPSLIIIFLTIVFGRVFCGWICPLGTLIDGAGKLIKPFSKRIPSVRYIKYVILIVVLMSAGWGLQLVGFFDPFAILVRGTAFSVDPLLNHVVSGFFDLIYLNCPAWMSNISEPVYSILKETILPFKQSLFNLSMLSFFILAGIFFIEKIGKRFWCRNLCPLGALLAMISRFSFLKRIPLKACSNCNKCMDGCRMNAFDTDGFIMAEECNLCMDCVDFCEDSLAAFTFKYKKNRSQTDIKTDITRRLVLKSCLAGVTLPLLSQTGITQKMPDPYLLRPPGALDEKDFLALCVRCGECMKVCIKNALQPTFLESGWEGMFSPTFIPRVGYCEFNCTLCGQVCPTGAIKQLSLQEKQVFVIGKSYFNKNRCLPFAKLTPCLVCEEHCPTKDKAIKFSVNTVTDVNGKTFKLKQPYINESLCIGCGICENVCPVDGEAAIRVIRESQEKYF